MNTEQIKKVESLIKEYHDAKKIKKDVFRNEIFQVMHPVIKRWINAIFSLQKKYLPKEELTAKTWDCFLYGLQYYVPKREIPIPNHFYTYTKFYLRIMQKKEIIKINKIDRQALTDYVKANPEYATAAQMYRKINNISPDTNFTFDANTINKKRITRQFGEMLK